MIAPPSDMPELTKPNTLPICPGGAASLTITSRGVRLAPVSSPQTKPREAPGAHRPFAGGRGFEPSVPRRIDDALETALFASAALPIRRTGRSPRHRRQSTLYE